ncbi:MAG: hypothetical protein ABFS05_08030 [Bacteroidota bacterium]
MNKTIFKRFKISIYTLSLIYLLSVSCNNQNNNNSSNTNNKINNDDFVENLNHREKIGDYDNLHYISNYLEETIDTIIIQYRFDLCLCPKWYIQETNEPIWLESYSDYRYSNYSDREIDSKEVEVIGCFYKYKAVPLGLYDFDYLREKFVPNARIFKIEKELTETIK